MSNETNPEQLEATVINTMALVLDLLVASNTVTTDVLVKSLDNLAQHLTEKGYGQSVGHMLHFRDFLIRRGAERSAVQSLLQEPPHGAA